jgi:hypothetical protein
MESFHRIEQGEGDKDDLDLILTSAAIYATPSVPLATRRHSAAAFIKSIVKSLKRTSRKSGAQ